jgi:DNA-binding transcriptional MocR family regulator
MTQDAAALGAVCASGALAPGEPAPSITTLSQEHVLARQTVAKAFGLLEEMSGKWSAYLGWAITWPSEGSDQGRIRIQPPRPLHHRGAVRGQTHQLNATTAAGAYPLRSHCLALPQIHTTRPRSPAPLWPYLP